MRSCVVKSASSRPRVIELPVSLASQVLLLNEHSSSDDHTKCVFATESPSISTNRRGGVYPRLYHQGLTRWRPSGWYRARRFCSFLCPQSDLAGHRKGCRAHVFSYVRIPLLSGVRWLDGCVSPQAAKACSNAVGPVSPLEYGHAHGLRRWRGHPRDTNVLCQQVLASSAVVHAPGLCKCISWAYDEVHYVVSVLVHPRFDGSRPSCSPVLSPPPE